MAPSLFGRVGAPHQCPLDVAVKVMLTCAIPLAHHNEGLGPVGQPVRLMDSLNNTYRALRIIRDAAPLQGNWLYAEFGGSFNFSTIVRSVNLIAKILFLLSYILCCLFFFFKSRSNILSFYTNLPAYRAPI